MREGVTVDRLVSDGYPFLALVHVKTANVKQFPCPVFLMIAKDCAERLSAVALSVGLIIPRG